MKKFMYITALLVIMSATYACKQNSDGRPASQKKEVRDASIEEFEQLLADTAGVVLIDVRTQQEYDEAHLKGAILIDVKDKQFRDKCISRLPAGKTIAIYCRSGFRSKTAAEILSEAGFEVINLKAGIVGWAEAGKETTKE